MTAQAYAGTGTVTAKWYVSGIVKLTLTPNYNSGYGTVLATFGTQPAPTQNAGACLQGCAIDFGKVQAGAAYLYKYAAHLNIFTNDSNGFNVYGEGAANFTDGSGNSMQLNQALYYLPSSASNDTNTGFSPGFAFNVTSGTVNPAIPSPVTAPTISYTSYPSPMFSSLTSGADYYQDYEIKVPATAVVSNYYVWIVYTVVPK